MAIKRTLTTQDIEFIAKKLGKVFVTKAEFVEFRREVNERFNAIKGRFDEINKKFDKSFTKLDEIVGEIRANRDERTLISHRISDN